MLQTCFGIYIVLAMFTFLIFWGTLAKARRYDEEKSPKSKHNKISEWVYLVNSRLNS